jgi:hypothetical protein
LRDNETLFQISSSPPTTTTKEKVSKKNYEGEGNWSPLLCPPVRREEG